MAASAKKTSSTTANSIEAGEDYRVEISGAIRQCPVVLAIIGPQWLTITDEAGRRRLDLDDDPVRLELESALETPSTRVIPVLVEGTPMPAAEDLPDSLQKLHYRNAWPIGERFTRDVEDLADDVEQLVHPGPLAHASRFWPHLRRHRRLLVTAALGIVVLAIVTTMVLARQSGLPQPSLAWKAQLGTRLSSSPAYGDGRVFIGTQSTGGAVADEDSLVALDAGTGTVQWSFRTGGGVNSSPVFADGVVYVGSDDGNLYALSATTGAKRWSAHSSLPVQGSPVVVDGLVVVGGDDGRLVAYDVATGRQVWDFNTGGRITTRVAVAGRKVYVGGASGTLFELPLEGVAPGEANLGLRRWVLAPMFSSPTVSGDSVVVGANDTDVHVIRLANGRHDVFPSPEAAIGADPAVIDGLVLVGDDDGVLWAFGLADLGQRWKTSAGPQIVTRPARHGSTVYVGSHSGELLGYRLTDGRRTWSYATGAIVGTDPLIVKDRLFEGNDAGTLYAFDLPR